MYLPDFPRVRFVVPDLGDGDDYPGFDAADLESLLTEDYDSKSTTSALLPMLDAAYDDSWLTEASMQTGDPIYSEISASTSHYEGSHNNDDLMFPTMKPLYPQSRMGQARMRTWVADVPSVGTKPRSPALPLLPTINEQPQLSKRRRIENRTVPVPPSVPMEDRFEQDRDTWRTAIRVSDRGSIQSELMGIGGISHGLASTLGDTPVVMSPLNWDSATDSITDSAPHQGALADPEILSPQNESPPEPKRRMPREKNGYHCDQCDSRFSLNSELSTHKRRKHDPNLPRPHRCPSCDKAFQYQKDLKRHLPIHQQDRLKLQCPFPSCGRDYTRKDYVVRHFKAFHPDEELKVWFPDSQGAANV